MVSKGCKNIWQKAAELLMLNRKVLLNIHNSPHFWNWKIFLLTFVIRNPRQRPRCKIYETIKKWNHVISSRLCLYSFHLHPRTKLLITHLKIGLIFDLLLHMHFRGWIYELHWKTIVDKVNSILTQPSFLSHTEVGRLYVSMDKTFVMQIFNQIKHLYC